MDMLELAILVKKIGYGQERIDAMGSGVGGALKRIANFPN